MSTNSKLTTNILTPRQSRFIQAYSSPDSPSFANAYQSAKTAGYSDLTARNITHLRPQWYSDSIGQIASTVEPQQLTEVLTAVIYSDMEPTILKLRAVELMMKYYGMLKQSQTSTTAVAVNIDLSGGSS